MRKILFKAKRVDTGEWVYGSLIQTTNPHKIEDEYWAAFIHEGPNISVPVPVIPETVCQFWRNHKDMNLWEGDIVLVNGRKRTGQYTTHIVFDGNQFKVSSNLTYMNDYATYLSIIEVTGNIHDK